MSASWKAQNPAALPENFIRDTTAPTNPPLRESYFTEAQLAQELPRCNVRKLRSWRNLRTGPRWFRVGREVAYLRSSVEEWLRSQEVMVEREQRPTRATRRPR